MAAGGNRKISAASARAHTRKTKHNTSSFQLPSGLLLLLIFFMGILAWAYQAGCPPLPKTCGSPDGPPVTASRLKLTDGRHLAYKEYGVPKNIAKYKIIHVHGFNSFRHDAIISTALSQDVIEGLALYIVTFDRPGYGESDPDPKRSVKSSALDIEELADQLGLGSKFYVVGFSMGGHVIWSCLNYIPHRLAGASLIAPAINYWWAHLPANLSKEAYNQQLVQDQWALRVAHYIPSLTYWWNTQTWFPAFSAATHNPAIFSRQDLELMPKFAWRKEHETQMKQQGEYESIHRDLMISFGTWEFDPLDLKNPFPSNEGSVHLWQGDEDRLVPATLQRYIVQQLPWIHYHEVSGAGHMFPFGDGNINAIVTTLLLGEKSIHY